MKKLLLLTVLFFAGCTKTETIIQPAPEPEYKKYHIVLVDHSWIGHRGNNQKNTAMIELKIIGELPDSSILVINDTIRSRCSEFVSDSNSTYVQIFYETKYLTEKTAYLSLLTYWHTLVSEIDIKPLQ